jgi:hypothetical protein
LLHSVNDLGKEGEKEEAGNESCHLSTTSNDRASERERERERGRERERERESDKLETLVT